MDKADKAEFQAWFALLETPGLGRTLARALLTQFGSAQGVWEADSSAWRGVTSASVAQAMTTVAQGRDSTLNARRALAWDWLQGGPGRQVVTLGDPAYPPAWLNLEDPPLMVYVQGAVADDETALADLWRGPSLAIVGSRQPTPQGEENARAFARHLGDEGWVVVSGLAAGIDAAAHRGALDSPSSTVAIMGTGPDQIYPRKNARLAQTLQERGGVVVTEFAPGSPVLPHQFPQRNRLIAGLTQGTLVVEAALASGSLITARLAMEAGREVFAIPGSIHSPQSKGCHALIRQGAKLVESYQDILDELPQVGRRMTPSPSTPEKAVAPEARLQATLAALGTDPLTVDELLARTGLDVNTLQAQLLDLELAGHVARLPGGLVQRMHRS